MNNALKKRTIYFDLLRIFATFSVVILHTASFRWHDVDVKSFEWNVFNFYDSIVRWTVPVFVMISGALMLNKDRSIKDLLKKNVLRMALAFLFWSSIYSLIKAFNGNDINYIIPYFIRGNYHLWFLNMIVGLYLLTPFLRKIVENESLTKYFLFLAIILNIGLPYIVQILSFFYPDASSLMKKTVDSFHMKTVLGYTVYYVLGYYLNTHKIDKKSLITIIILGLLGFIMTIGLTLVASLYTNKHYTEFYGNFTLNVFLESIFVFTVFKAIFENKEFSTKFTNIIYKISKYSFGIYLVHALIIDKLSSHFKINALLFNQIISVPVLAIVVFVISLIISAIINHIPKVKNFIV